MIQVEQKPFKEAVLIAAKVAHEDDSILAFVRLLAYESHLRILAIGGAVIVDRSVPLIEEGEIDILVKATKLKAIVRALRAGAISLDTRDDLLEVSQGISTKAELETRPSSEFPPIPNFEGMTQIYDGPNPAAGYEAIKHVSTSSATSQPLSDAVIVMQGRSYIATNSVAVRCDFSLVGTEGVAPFGLPLSATWILADLGKKITCHLDGQRILVVDESGYAVIMKHSKDPTNFAAQVDLTFASLQEQGQAKIPRKEVLRVVTAAHSILKSKEPVYLDVKCFKEQVEISGKVGRQSFTEVLPAKCTGSYVLPVHLARFKAFLQSSDDDSILMKVMYSDKIPEPYCAIHLVDVRLHEVISLPSTRPIRMLDQAV